MPPSLGELDAAIESQRQAQREILDAVDRRWAAIQLAFKIVEEIATMAIPKEVLVPMELLKLGIREVIK